MLKRFSHVMMYVLDLDRAVAWYGEHLGFTPRFVVSGAYASLFHEKLGCRLDLHPPKQVVETLVSAQYPTSKSQILTSSS